MTQPIVKQHLMNDEKRSLLMTARRNFDDKVDMFSRGKIYAILMNEQGMKAKQIARYICVSHKEVDDCLMAYDVPHNLWRLVRRGIITDYNMINLYKKEIDFNPKVKGEEIAQKIIKKRRSDIATHRPYVSRDSQSALRRPYKNQDVLDYTGNILNSLMANVDDTGNPADKVNVSMTVEQVAILKKAGNILS